MSLYEEIVSGKEKLSLVGLGYVGMPIAVAFAKKIKVVGFDLNTAKIELYKSGVDPTNEVGDEVIKATKVAFTADPLHAARSKVSYCGSADAGQRRSHAGLDACGGRKPHFGAESYKGLDCRV